jgi:phosphatidylglycerophosphate synthase
MGVVKHLVPRQTKQKIADTVNEQFPDGIVRKNLANAVTVVGAAAVVAGERIDGKAGLVLRGIGELADDVDGDISREFGISSKTGAFLDAILDKVKVAEELRVLWRHTNEFEPGEKIKRRAALGFIATKHTVNAVLNTTAQLKGLEPKSSTAGQINLWADGAAIAAFGASDVSNSPAVQEKLADAGYALVVASIPVGVVAAMGYARQLRQPSDETPVGIEADVFMAEHPVFVTQ